MAVVAKPSLTPGSVTLSAAVLFIACVAATAALAAPDTSSAHITSGNNGNQPSVQATAFYQPPALLPQPVMPPDLAVFDDYKRWLKGQVSEKQIPGVAVAIVSSEGILDVQTWGVRSVADQQPVTPQTVFRIASVSKTFAGTVGAQLVNHNILAWDEPISPFLPGYRLGTDQQAAQQLTLRHVLSHSTGLMPHAFSNLLDAGVAYDQIQQQFHEIPAVCPPGRCYGYQNVVFSLVADVIQHSLNTGYDAFVQENIFAPLGMVNASMGLDGYLNNPEASDPHQFGRGSWRVSTLNPAYYTVGPASGVNATILDMARWAQANLGGFPEILSPELLAMVHAPVVETPHGNYFNRWPKLQKAWYGLGWRVMDYADMRIIHHGGGVRGYRSEMVLVPEHNVALVVLFNAETPLANEVVPQFLDQLLIERAR